MTSRKPGPIARRLLRVPARLYDWNLGWLLGHRFLRLTHVGRRTGRTYQTMLEVIGISAAKPEEVIVLAGLGASADWYRNVRASGSSTVAIGGSRFRAVHRTLGEAEACRVLADYEHRNRWVAPLIRRLLSWLVGWQYEGSAAARERLVRELPVIAFRPAD